MTVMFASDRATFQRKRNDDIKARIRREPIADIARDYGLAETTVQKIARLGE